MGEGRRLWMLGTVKEIKDVGLKRRARVEGCRVRCDEMGGRLEKKRRNGNTVRLNTHTCINM